MIVAFDVGGTSLRSARASRGGAPTDPRRRSTPRADGGALVAALVEEAIAHEDAAGEPVEAVAIAIAGFLDVEAGVLLRSPNLDLVDCAIAAPVRAALSAPVRLVNDVNAAALGEAAAREARDLAAVFVGTGVGAGVVCGGVLLEGARGMAAEGGHVPFRPGGERCGCGRDGCVEAYLGGDGLARRFDGGAAEVLRRAREGEATARGLLDDAEAAMAHLADVLVALLDPETLVIGGTVAAHAPELLEAARRGAARRAGVPAPAVEPARLGDGAGLAGAAQLAARIADRSQAGPG